MKLVLFGQTGQVATEVQARAAAHGVDLTVLGRNRVDFTDPATVRQAALDTPGAAILNAVAYTAVDAAEDDADTARLVNATSVGALAEAAAERGVPLVHISTDYVFDGSGTTPRAPDAPTGPLGVYGQTKLEGEDLIRAAGGVHAILRTSWVFSAHGGNFVKTMLRLADSRDHLTVVADQIGGPTEAGDIAEAGLSIAKQLATGQAASQQASGTYHFAGAPDVSWADFAREIFRQTNKAVTVEDIPSENYPTPAARPKNSRLDCAETESVFSIPRPDWKDSLARVLKALQAQARS